MSTFIQRSFAGGEIAPSLHARTDISKYQISARTLRNTIVMRHGGAANRSGTKYLLSTYVPENKIRLIPFVYNANESYILEFGVNYVKVIRDNSYVLEASIDVTSLTKANPAVVGVASHGYVAGDTIYISGIGGMVEITDGYYVVGAVTGTTFELYGVDSTSYTTYTSGGTSEKIAGFVTTYGESQLFNLKYVQSGNIMTVTHSAVETQEITRVSEFSWTLSSITTAPEIATPGSLTAGGTGGATAYTYHVTAIDSETYEESLAGTVTSGLLTAPATNSHTVSWATVTGAIEYNIYLEVNGAPGLVGIARGTSFVNDGGVTPDTSNAPPEARSPFSTEYPAAVGYFQQRLCLANTISDTNKVWCSKTGIYKNFSRSTPIQDDDTVTFKMAGNQVNDVRHLLDMGRLIVLTSGGEWAAETEILTPSSVNLKQHTYYGSSDIKPIVIGESALYVQDRQSTIRDLAYNLNSDGYIGNDLTIFSSHLFDGHTIVDWGFQQSPNSILWVVRDDGIVLGLTYIKEQQMVAWHRHDMSGDEEFQDYDTEAWELDNFFPNTQNMAGDLEDTYVQSFDIGDSPVEVSSIDCGHWLNNFANRAGTYTMEIFAADVDSHPTGSALGTSAVKDFTLMATSIGIVTTYTFPTSVSLSANTKYCFVPDFSSASWDYGNVFDHRTSVGSCSFGQWERYDDSAGSWVVYPDDWATQFTINGVVNTVNNDVDGLGPRIESVAVIPGESEDSVYFSVRRKINGSEYRYIERLAKTYVGDTVDMTYMDSHLTYDGRNAVPNLTMTLSGGSTWAYDEIITLTCSSSFFAPGDVGNEVHFEADDGSSLRFNIIAYTSATVVTGYPHKTVPTDLRTSAKEVWTKAVDVFSGLDHLEGEDVSVFADGYVVASPNNADYDVETVTSGSITLDKPYGVVHVGLPYYSDIEPLDMELGGEDTMLKQNKHSSNINLYVEDTRGVWAGESPPSDDSVDPLENLTEFKLKSTDEGYDDPIPLRSGIIEMNLLSKWSTHGRVFIRQVDPLPLKVLALAVSGYYSRGK